MNDCLYTQTHTLFVLYQSKQNLHEELRPIRVFATVGHWQEEGFVMFESKVLICWREI